MDSMFLLDESSRIAFLFHHIIQPFGFTYICLWSYLPQPSNYLVSVDGIFNGENDVARRLFEEYRHSSPALCNEGRIPGFAFKNTLPYLELPFPDLERLASNEVQKQFYREAGIKIVIFMGCGLGEIELGLSSVPQASMEMEMKNLFPENFSTQTPPPLPSSSSSIPRIQPDPLIQPEPLTQPNPNRPSSSSSSLRSLSIDSPESLIFTTTTTTYTTEPPPPLLPLPSPIGAVDFPTMQQSEDDAMTRAYLAVISSSSPSTISSPSSSNPRFQENVSTSSMKSSFRRCYIHQHQLGGRGVKKQSILKRSFAFFRNLNLVRQQESIRTSSRPTTTQVHHMISERKRREKLNESFQLLRSLLPPGTKKDKASVLSTTTEELTSLKAKVEELSKQNKILEAQLSKGAKSEDDEVATASSGGGADVRLRDVGESTSEEGRVVELQVMVRGKNVILEMVIRLLEFLKNVENFGVLSVEANNNTSIVQSTWVNRIILRLRIQGGELDESTFLEAVRRVVDDMA